MKILCLAVVADKFKTLEEATRFRTNEKTAQLFTIAE